MSKQRGTYLQEKSKLECQLVTGRPQPKNNPDSLALSKIKVIPEVFQHRKDMPWKSEPHIKSLAKVIGNNQSIEPVTVWWSGKNWVCIDGHHRLEAYRSIAHDYPDVPVKVFKGKVDEAIKQAASGNTKDKLAMTPSEKLEAAWRLTIACKDLSKSDIAEASGASERTVANMRQVKRTLLEQNPNRDLSELSWFSAMALSKGKAQKEINWEDKLEKDAEKLASILAKNLPPQTRRSPELFARAIEIYDSRMADALAEHWNTKDEEDIEF